jgi:hypothetical protein
VATSLAITKRGLSGSDPRNRRGLQSTKGRISAKFLVTLSILISTSVFFPFMAFGDETGERQAITRMLHSTFDRPEAKLTVDPIVVEDAYAIADWTQGDMGGRALLPRKVAAWTLILCAGDGLKSTDLLKRAGVPEHNRWLSLTSSRAARCRTRK